MNLLKSEMKGAAPEEKLSGQELTIARLIADGYMSKEIAELLCVPEGKWVRSIIPFGVPTKVVEQKEKKSFEERVVWDHF